MRINTVVIAAGGRSRRLSSIAKSTQKCLLEVNDQPFLKYLLNVYFNSGFNKVYLLTGHHADKLRVFVEDSYSLGKPHLKPQLADGGIKGNAYTLFLVKNLTNRPFVYADSDVIYDKSLLQGLINTHLKTQAIVTCAVNPGPVPITHSHLVVQNKRVVNVSVDYENHPSGSLCCIGAYLFNPKIFSALPSLGNYPDLDFVIKALCDKGFKVGYFIYRREWYCLHEPADLIKLTKEGKQLLSRYKSSKIFIRGQKAVVFS